MGDIVTPMKKMDEMDSSTQNKTYQRCRFIILYDGMCNLCTGCVKFASGATPKDGLPLPLYSLKPVRN
jgi:hypothetical protein